jgi:hypothetical protein
MLRWLRRWRERDDQRLVKRAAEPDIDPIEELARIVGQAQDRDAEDERRLIDFGRSGPRGGRQVPDRK